MGGRAVGIMGLVLGLFFVSMWIFLTVRNKVQGRKMLDGRIIGIDHENRVLIIRYKLAKDSYQDIAYYGAGAAFLSGELPPIGLKVTVTVEKEAPYRPVSVHMMRRYRGGRAYANESRVKLALSCWGFGLFGIVFGIIFIFEL